MSQGRHRAPKPSTPPRRGLRRIAATLGIVAAAATGITLTTDIVATPQDTGWGAPDTNTVVATDDAGSTVDSIVTTVVHPSDSGWG